MRAKTVAGTPDSKDLHGARASLSHATARPRQAGTSFGSQPIRGGRRLESQANRDLSTLRPDSLPSRPDPYRLPEVSIRRILAHRARVRIDHTASSGLRAAAQTDRRLCVAGRWRVRRSRAGRNSRFWCLSYAGLLLPRSYCLRCSGRLAGSCPRQGEILSLAVSCCWRQSQRGGRGSRAPVSEPSRSGEPGPAVANLSGSHTVPARPAPASALDEDGAAAGIDRGYRSRSLPFSSACLINGRVVTCSCRSRSAVLI